MVIAVAVRRRIARPQTMDPDAAIKMRWRAAGIAIDDETATVLANLEQRNTRAAWFLRRR